MKRCFTALLLLVTLMLSGCSYLNVSHLDRRPWLTDTPQTISMKFWRFEFHNMPLKQGVGLQGTAYPNTELFPEWARYYDQLSFTVYLSESSGDVIASSQVDILPREMTGERAIPFEFRLDPEQTHTSLYVSFGYRMVLAETPWRPEKQQEGRIHLAHEGALTR
ncbi:hypothetical protein N1030_17040 [Desulfovibrio mangrovi]|uniref:hypothetical protein n=1 Tax=Desulfovibrio mangrovi TaxID=2976983 RepID=UPI00224512C0|nr:hypothetical protein [Desulfovibrio mangrovi]UZP67278.1 hypothetical protein N1030_17040 [Desulfovibrio mangrovi]